MSANSVVVKWTVPSSSIGWFILYIVIGINNFSITILVLQSIWLYSKSNTIPPPAPIYFCQASSCTHLHYVKQQISFRSYNHTALLGEYRNLGKNLKPVPYEFLESQPVRTLAAEPEGRVHVLQHVVHLRVVDPTSIKSTRSNKSKDAKRKRQVKIKKFFSMPYITDFWIVINSHLRMR